MFKLPYCAVLCIVAQSCPALCDLMDCSPPGTPVHGDSPGQNTGVDCHALLQGIFLIQRSNPDLLSLLHWQAGFFTTSATWETPGLPKQQNKDSMTVTEQGGRRKGAG